MRKKWIAALLLGLTLAVAGCSDLGIAPTDTASTEATASADAISKEATPAATKAFEDTASPAPTDEQIPTEEPIQTETPVPTETPIQMPEGIPEGFLDQELAERAMEEAQKVRYAYASESMIEGTMGDYNLACGFIDYDYSISCNKIVSYYDEDGIVRMTKYFQDEEELYTATYTPFGTLFTGGGEGTSWSGYSPIPYVETDAHGRKTAELNGEHKYFYAYDEAGRMAASRIYKGDQLIEDDVYAYDAKGNLTSAERMEANDDVTRETAYAYEWDEDGRIFSVTISFGAGGMISNHKYLYQFHYFDNGPVLMITYDQRGDTLTLEHSAYVFLPSTEIRTQLETGSGFSFPPLEEFLFQFESEFDKMLSLLGPQFETVLQDCCFYPEGKGRVLARISQNYTGDNFTTIISRLFSQNEFQMDASVKTDEGSYYGYDGEKLTSSYSYAGGGGNGFYKSLKYDSQGRPVEITIGANYECHYETSYDKAGHVSKVLYDYSHYFDESKEKGTVKFSHDADGKLSAVNAEFSGEGTKDGSKKSFRLTYELKPYENSDAE